MTVVRVRSAAGGWEAVFEVEPRWGDAASIARRLRAEGAAARRRGPEVIVDADGGVVGDDSRSPTP